MVRRDKSNYLIQSVSHALDVLEELAIGGELGVTELSKRLRLHKNNVFRLLATLELRGYVIQNKDSENYALGVKALELGQAYLTQSTLVARAMPVLKELADKVGETTSLAVYQNGMIQFPISIESKRPVKVSARVATSFPAKECASGRLLVAQMTDAALNEMLNGNAPQDAAIKNSLAELRKTGLMLDRAAIEADVVSMSKIVAGVNNVVVGAIEIIAPQYRAKSEVIVPALEEAASQLSTSLGSLRQGALQASLANKIEKDVTGSSIASSTTTSGSRVIS